MNERKHWRQSVTHKSGYLPARLGTLPASELVGATALALVAFANLISLYDGDGDTTTTLDLQSLLKLGFVGGLGLYSVQRMWVEPRMFRLMFGVPGGLLTAIAGWLLITSLFATAPAVSFASALVTAACIWGALGGVLQLGPEKVLRISGWACFAFLAGSWLLWGIDRNAATFLEPIEDGQFVARFGGLSHPNTIGQFSGLLIVISCLLFWPRSKNTSERWIFAVFFGVGVASLLACGSRTSILATALALGFAGRHFLLRGVTLLVIVALGSVAVAGLLVISLEPGTSGKLNDRLVSLVSKSGTTEELASGTGRSRIWAESIRLISQRPLMGYGPATSKDLLADYSRYTHNMLLNVGLSGGVPAMVLLVILFAYGFGQMGWDPRLRPDALFLFLFLNGLAENVCFLVLDSAPMIVFSTVLVWRNLQSPAGDRSSTGQYSHMPNGGVT